MKTISSSQDINITDIVCSLNILNKRAKTVKNPEQLYQLKYDVLNKLINENKAKKVCLHRFKRVRQAQNRTLKNDFNTKYFVLVECESHYFHLPANQTDIKTLKLELPLNNVRNKLNKMSYFHAKKILKCYLKNSL